MRDPVHPGTIKTSPPSLEGVIERRRLIDALANLKAGAKWLQSPSGTGKSTLRPVTHEAERSRSSGTDSTNVTTIRRFSMQSLRWPFKHN